VKHGQKRAERATVDEAKAAREKAAKAAKAVVTAMKKRMLQCCSR
jgi:hypothetical protein